MFAIVTNKYKQNISHNNIFLKINILTTLLHKHTRTFYKYKVVNFTLTHTLNLVFIYKHIIK